MSELSGNFAEDWIDVGFLNILMDFSVMTWSELMISVMACSEIDSRGMILMGSFGLIQLYGLPGKTCEIF